MPKVSILYASTSSFCHGYNKIYYKDDNFDFLKQKWIRAPPSLYLVVLVVNLRKGAFLKSASIKDTHKKAQIKERANNSFTFENPF